MKKLIFQVVLIFAAITMFTGCDNKKSNENILFVCSQDNDLYRAMSESNGNFARFSDVSKALDEAKENSALLVLADNYPAKKTFLPDDLFTKAKEKNIRLYIEFPNKLPGRETGDIHKIDLERGVITSDAFGSSLKKMRIVNINDCHYVDVEAKSPHMVVARVAGFDTAVYGLNSTETHPVLFEISGQNILVSTTKLSQFITGRYAPKDAWKAIWGFVFHWLQPGKAELIINWTDAVHPSHPNNGEVTEAGRLEAIKRGVDWYYNSNLLATIEQVEKGEMIKVVPGGKYGTEGIRECYLSKINYDGSQPVSENRRADCTSESAMALALRGVLDNNQLDKATAENLQDYIYFNSRMRQGPRNDSKNPEYGFIDWFERENDNEGVYYSDDNARVVMGTIASAVALKTNKWDEFVVANILANYRATSPFTGFKPRRLDGSPKSSNTLAKGWRIYHNSKDYYSFAPHYQSWIMAMYIWLYDKTKYKPLLEVAKTGIENMMNVYPDEWHWTNGLQQERARMILPLAWLLRIEDTPQHREWLNRVVDDLLGFQDECGAIREEIGSMGHGKYGPPKSNADYGTNEAPLIQENGEPVADMLYTSNFAFLSLTEAAAVTGDKKIEDAVSRLADFMVKIQVRSETRPEFDGAWFRAFEYNRWDYWASNADRGWGVWSTETGWQQGWITTMLMMREMNTNFWAYTAESKVAEHFDKYRKLMLSEIEK